MEPFDPSSLAERLKGLELSPVPVWVLDPDAFRIRWANDLALDMWRAPSREELLARDFSGGPQAVKTRLAAAVEVIREGGSLWDEWTFFPKGVPVRMKIHFAPVPLGDGRVGVLHHVHPRDEGPDPAALRGIEALSLTSVMIALADFEGNIVMKNPAALEAFGRTADDWKAWLVEPDTAAELLRRAAADEVVRREVAVRTEAGERFHAVEVRSIRDAVTGTMMALIHHTDETARHGAEVEAERQLGIAAELERTLTLVDQQRREILALSAPLLDVGARAVAVPIIGVLDAERSTDVENRLLPAIGARQARVVILDLTGAAALDVVSAERLTRIVGAVRLLGARTILTGIGPALAEALVASGFSAPGTPIVRTLAEGLRLAQSQPTPRGR